MIAVLVIRENFSHQTEYDSLEAHCRQLMAELAGAETEFFDILQVAEPRRYFVIRAAPVKRENFIETVEAFGARMNFEILKRRESEEILFRHDLDSFV